MIWHVTVFTVICLPKFTQNIDVKIEGFIDVGTDSIDSQGFDYEIIRSSNKIESKKAFVLKRNNNNNDSHDSSDFDDGSQGEDSDMVHETTKKIIKKPQKKRNKLNKKIDNKHEDVKTDKENQKVGKKQRKLKVKRLSSSEMNEYKSNTHLRSDKQELSDLAMNIYGKQIKVKDLSEGNQFTVHVFRRAIKTFETVKRQIKDKEVKRLLDAISYVYKDKFIKFVKDTQEQNVRTRIGPKKVVLNIIDTSNRILMRLVNNIRSKGIKRGRLSLNAYTKISDLIHKDLSYEYKHVCKKFGVCRSVNGFSSFVVEFIKGILKLPNYKLKQSFDALTEVLKTTTFSGLDKSNQLKLRKAVEHIETLDLEIIRPGLLLFKNSIEHRNEPFEVYRDENINKTVAFLDVIDTLDKVMAENKKNLQEKQEILNDIKDFEESTKVEAEKIAQDFMERFVKDIIKGLNLTHGVEAKSVNNKIGIIVRDVY